MFIVLLSFCGSLTTECMILNSEPCIARPTLIGLNFYELSQELGHYPFIVNVDRRNGSCNTFVDPSSGIFFPNKTEDVNLNAFDMIAGINQSK